MPDLHRIEDLPPLAGQTAITRGWVMTTRSSGKIGFVMLRDGTGTLQVVLSKKDVPEAAWDGFGRLAQETSVEVTGTVRADARAPGGVELTAAELRILGPSADFPITPKEHGTAFLFEHRHLWLRSRRQVAIAGVRHEVIPATPDRVLAGRARGGVERLGRQHAATGGVRLLDRGALPRPPEIRARRARARRHAARGGPAAVPPHLVHGRRDEAQDAGQRHGVGTRPGG